MARTVHIHLTDDLDDSPADETVAFALDGVAYEIDLNSTHADDLRRAPAPYVVVGRRAARGVIIGGRAARETGTTGGDRARNRTIREWALSREIQINGRGRIPADVVERYEKETGR